MINVKQDTPIIFAGDTTKITMEYRTFAKEYADPEEEITINFYEYATNLRIGTNDDVQPTRVSAGIYTYFYTVPMVTDGNLVIEIITKLEGYPIVARKILPVKWV